MLHDNTRVIVSGELFSFVWQIVRWTRKEGRNRVGWKGCGLSHTPTQHRHTYRMEMSFWHDSFVDTFCVWLWLYLPPRKTHHTHTADIRRQRIYAVGCIRDSSKIDSHICLSIELIHTHRKTHTADSRIYLRIALIFIEDCAVIAALCVSAWLPLLLLFVLLLFADWVACIFV